MERARPRSTRVLLLTALLAAGLWTLPPSAAFPQAACARADETESPPWVERNDLCTGYTVGPTDILRFWTFVDDDITINFQSALGATHTYCVRPVGSPWSCRNVLGQGDTVDFLWRSPNTGETRLAIAPYAFTSGGGGSYYGGEYLVRVDTEAAMVQNDCGLGHDAEAAHSIADAIGTSISCAGVLLNNDAADFYRVQGGKDGLIQAGLTTDTGDAQVCIYPPSSAVAAQCSTFGTSGGSFSYTPSVNGSWRIGVLHGSGDPNYQLALTSTIPNYAPSVLALSCALDGAANESTLCSFRATDPDLDDVAYLVDWGDGSGVTRVPATGHQASGAEVSAAHSWPAEGTYDVSVRAIDDGTPVAESLPLGISYTLVNHAPTMSQITCDALGAANVTTACLFRANDRESHPVAYTIDWGDGSPTTRFPPEGHVASNAASAATHVWSAPGTYTVSASALDVGAPPLGSTSLAMSYLLQGTPVLGAPQCTPAVSLPTEPVTCTILATDDSAGIAYTVTWGDGASERVPQSGFVAPGTQASVMHAFAANGTYAMRFDVIDNGTPARQASVARSHVTRAQAPTMDLLSCGAGGPAGTPLYCSMRASDDSPLLHYEIDWGDGAPLERVPGAGSVAPNVQQTASHTWSAAGYHLVRARATDDTILPLTSAWREVTFPVGLQQHVTGSFRVGGPGVSALVPPIVPAPPVDGQWIELAAPGRSSARPDVTLLMPSFAHMDVWFYDALFQRIDDGECATQGAGVMERCSAPAGATYAHVRLATGSVNAWFDFTYLH